MAENKTCPCNSTSAKTVLPFIYGTELCVALVGNLFALWILVMKERKNWHTGVVFSCNLAISDILYVLTFPLLIDSLNKDWKFGGPLCKIERFLFVCNLYVSIYFIMCISFNRYLAIVHPFFTRKRVRPKHAKMVSVLVWIIVAILSSPVFMFAGVEKPSNRCRLFTEDKKSYKYSYRVFMAVVGCLIPFVVTFSSYSGIIWVVLRNANISTLEKRKVALIVVSVFLIYIISLVPYHILQLLHFSIRERGSCNCAVRNAHSVTKALTGINMCLHPILYLALLDNIKAFCCRESSSESM